MNNSNNISTPSEGNLDIYTNRHTAMASRLDDQAQVRHAKAKRELNRAHMILVVIAVLLGMAAATALNPFLGGLLLVAFLIGVIIHLCLGGGVEAIIYGRTSGNGTATFFGVIAVTASIILLIGIALARAAQMVENGKPPAVAYALSFAISLFEIGLPSLVGYYCAQKADQARHAHDDMTFFKELHGHVITAPEDAPGLFQDSQEELRDQIQQARSESTGASHERSHISRLEERLRLLKKADPGMRYKRGEDDSLPKPSRVSSNGQDFQRSSSLS